MLPIVLLLAVLGSPESPRETPPSDRVAEAFARAVPEHKLAMLEARRWVPSIDLGVARAKALLSRVDALYTEDAPRIVEIVELFWRAIREEGRETSPLEMLEGATAWREPVYFKDGNRSFEEFVVLYSALRIGREGRPGVSHARAVALLKTTARAVVPGGN